jgi:DNA-binding Lrp family transcriptional regulator
MDSIDHAIIRELQIDGRLTNQELADRVGLSPSPCLRRVKKLEAEGVIAGYVARIDPRAYGVPVIAFVRLRLDQHRGATVQEVENRLRAIPHVQDCYLMAGDCDYLLKVMVRDLESYEIFIRSQLHAIPAVTMIDTSFSFGVIKQGAPLPPPD